MLRSTFLLQEGHCPPVTPSGEEGYEWCLVSCHYHFELSIPRVLQNRGQLKFPHSKWGRDIGIMVSHGVFSRVTGGIFNLSMVADFFSFLKRSRLSMCPQMGVSNFF